ncbi:hypothetical protein IQ268_05780 [Oculatella sp. LEGE 06141]|uniref:hypothetical protein n=1 Tax=Oculatella sp. LEGE 06141 TaxID=1828648 RepID=UPI00187F4BE3|nr:hypothetical protein [Oculatella sp. LEGE 06141]MBE9178095.1 hypothetical protein [Oculatella sp. LEGE 06141]
MVKRSWLRSPLPQLWGNLQVWTFPEIGMRGEFVPRFSNALECVTLTKYSSADEWK